MRTHSANVRRALLIVGGFRPSFGQTCTISGRHPNLCFRAPQTVWPPTAARDCKLALVGSLPAAAASFVLLAVEPSQMGPTLQFGPSSAQFGQTWSNTGQVLPKSSKHWPHLPSTSTKLWQIWSTSGQNPTHRPRHVQALQFSDMLRYVRRSSAASLYPNCSRCSGSAFALRAICARSHCLGPCGGQPGANALRRVLPASNNLGGNTTASHVWRRVGVALSQRVRRCVGPSRLSSTRGKLGQLEYPMHGKPSVVEVDESAPGPIFDDLPKTFGVARRPSHCGVCVCVSSIRGLGGQSCWISQARRVEAVEKRRAIDGKLASS